MNGRIVELASGRNSSLYITYIRFSFTNEMLVIMQGWNAQDAYMSGKQTVKSLIRLLGLCSFSRPIFEANYRV